MRPLLLDFGRNRSLFERLAAMLDAEPGAFERRRFPDGETYLRFDCDPSGRRIGLVCSLDRPDAKVLPLLLASAALRDLGAAGVGLIAPYLAYMRQDKRFQPGEGISARYFAALVSDHFDWLATVDPHLHRFDSLNEIYSIPTATVPAAPALAAWIDDNVARPVLIGPDRESEQWVAEVAKRAAAPYEILEKVRSGDREVRVSTPRGKRTSETPIIVDDIVSTAQTLIETIGRVREAGMPAPICIAVHAVFADGALEALTEAGAKRVVTCNTIAHPTNRVDVSELLAAGVAPLLGSHQGEADG